MGDEDAEPQYQVLYIDQPNEEPEGWIKRAGRARVNYVDGSTYEGDFNEAQQKHGQGTYTWSYDAIKEVEGVPEWAEPEEEGEPAAPQPFMRYAGGYQYGLKHGLGFLEYPNGDTYRGQFAFDKRHGAGTYKYNADGTGNIYSGEWRNGLRHGKGAFVFGSDGSQLVGDWVDGNIVSGKWLLRDGSVYCGDFNEKNKPNGKGSFVFPNGSMITGTYGVQLGEDEEPDEEDEDGAIGATHWTTSELVQANCSASELNRASLPQRPFVPTVAKRVQKPIAEGARYTPFPIRYDGGSRAETGNNGLSIADVVEVGAVIITNTDLRPARIEGDEEGAEEEEAPAEDEEELGEEDEDALARRLTANLRGITLTHTPPGSDAVENLRLTLPELHVARGERVRLLFGDCAANPKLADPVVEPQLDEDGNPVEEEPAEPIPTKDLVGSVDGRNIFADGVGTLRLTFVDVHGDEQVLWERVVQTTPADEEGGEPTTAVAVGGLNFIRGPDPLPEPEPEGEGEEEDE